MSTIDIEQTSIPDSWEERVSGEESEPVETPTETLSNPNPKYRTKPCVSVIKGTACPYPEGKCQFSHELLPCSYGLECFHVLSTGDNVYVDNPKTRINCKFIHPGETKANYATRMRNRNHSDSS